MFDELFTAFSVYLLPAITIISFFWAITGIVKERKDRFIAMAVCAICFCILCPLLIMY